MQRIILISIASFIIPLYGMVAIASGYLSRVYYTGILAHTVLLIVICSTAFSICHFFYINFVHTKSTPFFVVAVFFEILGIVLLFHSISIPSFYFISEDTFDVTEHFGLLFSGIALLLLFVRSARFEEFLYRNRRGITRSIALALFVWFVLLVSFNELSAYFSTNVDYATATSGILVVVGIYAMVREHRSFVCYASFSYLIAGLSVMVNATIIPFFYKEWNVLWWYFHIVILCAGLIIFFGILRRCDKKVCVLSNI